MEAAATHKQSKETGSGSPAKPFFAKSAENSFFSSNQNIRSFFPAVQTKLTLGQPGDKYEQEADTVAGQVVQRLNQPIPSVQRMCTECAEEEEKGKEEESPEGKHKVQRKAMTAGECNSNNRTINRSDKATNLTESNPDDPYEREADRVAGKVMNMSSPYLNFPSALIQHQRLSEVEDTTYTAQASIEPSRLLSGGMPMNPEHRQFYESRLGYDLEQVRVHTGQEAEKQAAAMRAYAFTYGNHIWLGQGQSTAPSFLMAHELTHFVQQNQPSKLAHTHQESDLVSPRHITHKINPQIQEVSLYWTPVGISKGMSGTQIHNEVTPKLANPSKGVEREVGIPNADREESKKLGLSGKADFYKGENNRRIGIYFTKGGPGSDCTNGPLGKPATLKGGGKTGQPKVRKGKITGIDKAPTKIWLGELKPVDPDQIQFGQNQLANYVEGIKFARHQANCWHLIQKQKGKSSSPRGWGSITFDWLGKSDLPIPKRYEYNPSSPRKDRRLGVADFIGAGEGVRLVFNPFKELRQEIRGGLYVTHVGNGILAYFAKPADPASVLKLANISDLKKAYAKEATKLQNKVIGPLFTAPKKQQSFSWQHHSSAYKKAHVQPKPLRPTLSPNPKMCIQRKGLPRLVDNFKLPEWKKNHSEFSKQFKNPKEKKDQAALKFVELIYEAEESLHKQNIPKPAQGQLPPRSDLDFQLEKDPKSGKKPKTKNISRLYSWMNLWSNPAMKFLGILRDKFGGAFVKVSRFVTRMKLKLQNKLDKAKKKNTKKGNSFGAVAVRAFWRAAAKIGGLVFENTVKLLVTSLEKGLSNVISKIIPVDVDKLTEMAENEFSGLKTVQKQIEALQEKVKDQIDDAIKEFDKEIEALKSFAETAEKYGKIIKWAMIALNCASPPGLGCLKVLAKGLMAKMVDEILQWCWTQKKFTGIVLKTGWFDTLPSKIAGFTADKIEALLPEKITPVFDRSVFNTASRPSVDEIPCGEQPTAEQTAMLELEEELKAKLGEEGFELLIEALQKYGVPLDQELTIDLIMEIKDKIPEGVTVEQLANYLASHPKPLHQKGEAVDVAEFLNKVKATEVSNQWYYVAHPPSSGHTKYSTPDVKATVSLSQPCSSWYPLQELTIPAKVTKRIWVESGDKKIFQITYEARKEVKFIFQGEEQTIKKGEVFWGYRPDVCKR